MAKREIKTGDPVTDRLYEAVVDYAESRGGTAVVIGGVAVVLEDPDRPLNYGVMVRLTGKRPEIPAAPSEGRAQKEEDAG